MSYENWINEVEHELIMMGLSSCEASDAITKSSEWFKQQFDSELLSILAADKWFAGSHRNS